ncbi:MAG: hypothetical protein WCX25_05980 [Candidatus Izemoplasmatales bacterium]
MKTNFTSRRMFIVSLLSFFAFMLISCESSALKTSATITSTVIDTTQTTVTSTSSTIIDQLFSDEPGIIPQIFAPNFISTDANHEFAGTFSPDYMYYFFTRRALEGNNRLFFTEYIDGSWTQPELSPISEDVEEFEPFITPNGTTMYFGSMRDNHDDYVFYQSTFVNGNWQTPVYVENGLNQEFAMYVSVSNLGNIYFTGLNGIYVIKNINGEFQPREAVGIHGSHPYIAPDESYMLFDRQVGTANYIYIVFKSQGYWGTPRKLGSDINLYGAEQICASVTSDGKYLFFSRFVSGTSDIFWVDADYLDQYRY